MKREDYLIVWGTAHRRRVTGKCSPDGRLVEYLYSREICKDVNAIMHDYGYKSVIDYEPIDLPKYMWSTNAKTELNNELSMRVNYVNQLCKDYGDAKRVLYVSIHVDASGSDNKWHKANGWSVRVSPKASLESKFLANCLFDAAKDHGMVANRPTKQQKYWEQSLKVLNDTCCPAVLTENLFQDNRDDVDFLLSDEGIHTISRIHVEGVIRYIDTLL